MISRPVTKKLLEDDRPIVGSSKLLYPHLNSANTLSPGSVSTVDIRSPMPTMSFSPRDQPMTIAKKKLQMALAELVQSEYMYLGSLKRLRDVFFDTCVDNTESSYSLKIVKYCLLHLIEIHTSLIDDLARLFPSDRSLYQIAELFAQRVCESAICRFWYEEYIKQYEDFLKIAKLNNQTSNDREVSIRWATAWQKYLEKSQQSKKHLDFSIESLSQGPISRISKYKLLVESIHKQCKENLASSQKVKCWMDQIHSHLSSINDNSWKLHQQQSEFNERVESIINFRNIPFVHELSIEFFGNALLVGSETIIWIEAGERGKISTYPILVFKSHLIICDCIKSKTRRSYKQNIKFIIPLSKTWLVTEFKSCGGIFCEYPYAFKIIFEINSCQYEFAMVFLTESEFSIWRNLLDTLINYVNGPCDLNFIKDEIKYVCVFPQEICSYNIDLDGDNYKKNIKKCYFKHSINIRVKFDFPISELQSSTCLTNYFENDNSLMYQQLVLKKSNVVANQKNLESIWSKELPIHFRTTTTFTEVVRSWSLRSTSSLTRKWSFRKLMDQTESDSHDLSDEHDETKEGNQVSHDDIPEPVTARSNSLKRFKDSVSWYIPSSK
ncbi:uncharacterized protein SPAPADRAFT_137551 [Spathaspora passalidarum NRRL Y-27907]|uniref:DH domain-containing protein n=1 Tax=Spathaspora passalidarum (strain NRRL Y-27907 / 11-Y1) TaxID=619300 RepID=G3AKW6_SPAPN|nr:uncharacterized protein SPAPADRAFT_137551 [Spathaspora passalidarum NRRL Y-27907]EGW33009.1 hypothetical protein SPAPADRAFT_137551 [Spathaspora passalidarum NRRL Y-27907]